MSKFRYPIFPDRTYTIMYDDFEYEVTGEEIMVMFRRDAMLQHLFENMEDVDPPLEIAPDKTDKSG